MNSNRLMAIIGKRMTNTSAAPKNPEKENQKSPAAPSREPISQQNAPERKTNRCAQKSNSLPEERQGVWLFYLTVCFA